MLDMLTICIAWSSVKLYTKAWFDFNNKKIKKGANLPHFASFTIFSPSSFTLSLKHLIQN